MQIKHNTYSDGQVQSLGLVEGDSTTMTVGVILPGEYDFGTAERQENITVLEGALIINGSRVTPRDFPLAIKPNQPIKIEASVPTFYKCQYL